MKNKSNIDRCIRDPKEGTLFILQGEKVKPEAAMDYMNDCGFEDYDAEMYLKNLVDNREEKP